MTDEERKKMWKDLLKMIDDQILQQSQQLFMQGNWGGQSGSFSTSTGSVSNGSISPTDKDAKGRFPYQEPEQDEQGTYYGYKILDRCACGCGQVRSPRYPATWENGELQADREPSEQSMFGIHFTKHPDHPALNDYYSSCNSLVGKESILVQCALSGTIVETEQGYRAEHAMITGVFYNGHWTTYQGYQERTAANSRINPWEENYWKANYDFNPRGTWTWDTNSTPKKGKGGKHSP